MRALLQAFAVCLCTWPLVLSSAVASGKEDNFLAVTAADGPSNDPNNATADHLLQGWWFGGDDKKKKAPRNKGKKGKKERTAGVSLSMTLCGQDYVTRMSLGNERKMYRVAFDSSRDVLMSFSKDVLTSGKPNTDFFSADEELCWESPQMFFDDISPTGGASPGVVFQEKYPDGSLIEGAWVHDTLRLGGTAKEQKLKAKNVAFVLSHGVKGDTSKGVLSDAYTHIPNSDAIFGLGFSSDFGTPRDVFPPVLSIFEQHTWHVASAFFYISPTSVDGSHISFGTMANKDLIVGDRPPHFHMLGPRRSIPSNKGGGAVSSKKLWESPLVGVEYNGVEYSSKKSKMVASFETARSTVSLPTDLYKAIIKATDAEDVGDDEYAEQEKRRKGGSTIYAVCDKVYNMPPLTFRIGGTGTLLEKEITYSLDGFDLTVAPTDCATNESPLSPKDRICEIFIEDGGKSGNLGLGHPFLRKYYTGFMYQTTRNMETRAKYTKQSAPLIAVGESKAYADWKSKTVFAKEQEKRKKQQDPANRRAAAMEKAANTLKKHNSSSKPKTATMAMTTA